MTRRAIPGLVTALALTVSCGVPEAPPAVPAELPPVFLIVVDCLRADHLGAYGYEHNTSPFIDQLAAESILFEHVVAQSNWTKPSMASLLTGTQVSQHGLREGRLEGRVADSAEELDGHTLSESLTTWAEALAELGYTTAGFVNQGHLTDYMGFAQGFATYEYGLQDPQVEARFAEWLGTVGDGVPFGYVHLLDLHFPYDPPEHVDRFFAGEERPMRDLMRGNASGIRQLMESRRLEQTEIDEIRALYDGEVVVVDDRVGRVLRAVREAGLYDDAIIVVTADHGELLLEHDALEHGGDRLYEPVLHIPWVMRLPGGQHAGARVTGSVQMADIFPTVLGLLDAEAPAGIAGRDAMVRLDDSGRRWPILAETSDVEGPRALYTDDLKFVFRPQGQTQVFDPIADPGETHDLVDEIAASRLFAAAQLLEQLEVANRAFAAGLTQERAELAPAQIEQLRALGYIR